MRDPPYGRDVSVRKFHQCVFYFKNREISFFVPVERASGLRRVSYDWFLRMPTGFECIQAQIEHKWVRASARIFDWFHRLDLLVCTNEVILSGLQPERP